MKNILALVGLETIMESNHRIKFFANTFLNNVTTWQKDHPDDQTKILDARKYKDHPNPIGSMRTDSINAFPVIDILYISCHSDPEGLYLFSHYRKGDIPDSYRYIDTDFDWSQFKFNPEAMIYLAGCRTVGDNGVIFKDTIAQDIANKTDTPVNGFNWKSSQHERQDGGFEQKPDHGTWVRLFPKVI